MKKTLSFFLLYFLSHFSIHAAHIIGGQLTYVCDGNGTYEITMKLYRDCYGGGAGFDSAPFNMIGQLSIYQGTDEKLYESIILDAPDITEIDPDLSHLCGAVPPDLCVEEGTYTFTVNLPLDEESYHLVYQRCCRNNTISNISNPGETGATYQVEISPESQALCNNSPVFNEYPPVIICANQELFYDHSASDPDGDSLVYEFCAPLLGGSLNDLAPNPEDPPPYNSVSMIEPLYTIDQPMAGDPLVSIDPATGLITGTPTIQGQFVVGVCVKEYNDGKLVGTIQRDFQFNVTACGATVVADLNGSSPDELHFYYESCQGETLTLLNESYNISDIDNYFWTMDIDGSTPQTAVTPNFTATFPLAGTFNGLMILNRGSACSDTAWVEVLVHPTPTTTLHYDFDPCEVGAVQFSSTVPLNGLPIDHWLWDFGDGNTAEGEAPQHQYAEEGIYDVELIFSNAMGCQGVENIEVNYELEATVVADLNGSSPDELHFYYESCQGEPLTLLNESYNIADIDNYFWTMDIDGSTPQTAVTPNFTATFPFVGTFNGSMVLNRESACSDTAWVEVVVHPTPTTTLHYDFDPCEVGPVQFSSTVPLSGLPIDQWLWDFGDGNIAEGEAPQHQYAEEGIYEVELIFSNAMGCQGVENIEVYYDLEAPVVLTVDSAAGCAPLTVVFDDLTNLVDTNYQIIWDLGDGNTSNQIALIHEYGDVGVYDLEIEVESTLGCLTNAVFPEWIRVDAPPVADFSYAPEEVFKLDPIRFEDKSERAIAWQWMVDSIPFSEEQNSEWTFTKRGLHEIELLVEDQYGCQDSMTQTLDVIPVFHLYVPNAFSPNDDGNNDGFRAYTSCPLAHFQLKIFDRWGALVFESEDIEQAWDGYRSNELFGAGVFTWWINYLEETGTRTKSLKGDVTLLK